MQQQAAQLGSAVADLALLPNSGKSTLTDSLVAAAGIIAMEQVRVSNSLLPFTSADTVTWAASVAMARA